MQIIKQDDSALDVLYKIFAILGIGFGVWAYYHTVQPVFQKEKKLEQLRIENHKIENERQLLNKNLNQLKNEKKALNIELLKGKNELTAYQKRSKELSQMIKTKEECISNLSRSLERSNRIAKLHKLESISNQLIAKYIDSIQTSSRSDFDIIETARLLLDKEKSNVSNEYEESAVKYFEAYINKHGNKKLFDRDVIGFATSLPYDFKITIIEKTKKPVE
jgi:uncharacterized protein (DUF3084 family)